MVRKVKINYVEKVRVAKMWAKRIIGVSMLFLITYVIGTFNPNDYKLNKLSKEYEYKYLEKLKELDLREPEFTYNNDMQFVRATHKCIDYHNFTLAEVFRVPYEMVTAQAALESGWGTSRFAKEGNNLFGIRVFNKDYPHMLPLSQKEWKGWGVRIFATKCDSVKEYIRLMNEHPAYEKFRKLRLKQLAEDGKMDPIELVKTLDKFSTTPDYAQRVIVIIKKIRKLEEIK
tara:strand:- start:3253 stop:3942 length:690 start_codon:yes stop_codon:yes gene_type:complete